MPGERIRLLDGRTLAGTEWILASGAQRLWRVFHEQYELCVLPPEDNEHDGGASYTYRRWHIPCRPDAVYLLEPDTLHANHRLYGPSSYYVIKVERAMVAAIADELGLGDRPHFRMASTDSRGLMAALARLSAAAGSAEMDPLEKETRLVGVLRMVLEECGEGFVREPTHAPDALLARAREYLHAHATTSVTIRELSEVTGLSRYHLVRSFARSYGLPPHAYQTQLRVAEARRQLAAGTPPAAVDAGFFDQAHLTRHFKRAYAVTPAAYQRAISS
ncbi:MAG: helix-turn-helix domain-containing protein [Candidatus Limnocylindria bacterium]